MLRLTRASRGLVRARALCTAAAEIVEPRVLLSTTDAIAGHTVSQHLGLVTGSTVRTKDVAKDLFASVRTIFGGEITTYTELLNEARAEALLRLKTSAATEGANAVLAVRISTTSLPGGASELLAYGSAVKLS